MKIKIIVSNFNSSQTLRSPATFPIRSRRETDSSSGKFSPSSNLLRTPRPHSLPPGPALSPGPPPHCPPLPLRPVRLFLQHQSQQPPYLPPRCRPGRPRLLRLLSQPSLPSRHCSCLLLLSETSSTLTERGGLWLSSPDIRCFTTSLPTGHLPLPTCPTRAPPCLPSSAPSLLPSPGPHTCQATDSSSGGGDIKTIRDFMSVVTSSDKLVGPHYSNRSHQ